MGLINFHETYGNPYPQIEFNKQTDTIEIKHIYNEEFKPGKNLAYSDSLKLCAAIN